MAEEIIVGVVIGVLEKTIAMAAERSGLMPGFKGELKKMEGLVRDIQARVADAEGKKVQNQIVLGWLKDFKGAILEAENVLDELHYEGLRRKVHEANCGQREVHKIKRGAAAKVCSFFSMFKHDVSFRVRMNPKVRGINEELKAIKQKAEDLNLAILKNPDLLLDRDSDATVEALNRKTHSLPEEFVAGRREEESAIVDKLLSVSSSDNNPSVSVLPIVGMGGLGKTTLAKLIYNNGKIVNHFSKRSWICVSDDKFDVTSILKGILESLKGGDKLEMSSLDAIVQGIQKELNGERFLFVLDDVWNVNHNFWKSFFDSLVGLNTANGSCCLLTTRLHKTADLVHTSSFHPFKLDKLSDDSCWFIIGKKATKGGEMPVEFDIHKEEILRKCKGLPLAANAFGCLLSSQRREDWVSVVEALIVRVVEDGDGDIMPILKLSYDYLPHPRIKKCFAYCSVYCKDAKMRGRDLIELWMAEGYLRDDVQGKTMEEDGAGCLKLLLQSSLLEKKDDAYYGVIYYDATYQMHDLVHDLACSISDEEYHDGDIHRNFVVKLNYGWNEKSRLIRVLEGDVSDEMLSKCRHARVMNLFGGEINKLPNAIGNLKHIRCLTISLGGIKSLPESLCKLYNLQTLRLRACRDLECLPQGLSNLISLRHLYYDRSTRVVSLEMAPYMGRLTHLQTLEFFNVGEKNGCEIRELGPMKNLKGSLSIGNIELVKGKEEATSANLVGKKNLTRLELTWGSIEGHRRKCDKLEDEQVLEGLEPCSALQRLMINHFMGVRFPKWLGKLSALEVLELRYCENITELGYSGDGGFPKLKTLKIYWCPQLSSAPTSFPVLQKLDVSDIQASAVSDIISTTTNSLEDLSLWEVSGMRRLSDIVIESPLLSCLKELEIRGCGDMTEIPSSTLECCRYLESLTVIECPELVSCPLNLSQQTPSLSTIKLTRCPKLFTRDGIQPRGFEHLTNLKVLEISPDNSQHSIDWDGLKTGCSTTLRTLGMHGSPRTELPQQLEDFSSLVTLWISGFDSIERLPGWLAKLTSLQLLELRGCPKLKHLPTDAIRSLTNLQELRTVRCPLLRETQGDEINALPNLKVDWIDC